MVKSLWGGKARARIEHNRVKAQGFGKSDQRDGDVHRTDNDQLWRRGVDIDKEVEQFAARSGRTSAAVRAQLEKEGGLARLAAGLRREKAVDFAMSRAKMTTD